jgi:phage repressor protein C with HTH and peptisase S24 domain
MKNQETEYFRKAYDYCFKRSPFKNQKEVAQAAEVSEAAISEIKNGKKSYGTEIQSRIAKTFGYELLDFKNLGRKLLEGEEPAKIDKFLKITETFFQDERTDIFDLYRRIPIYESGRLAAGTNGLIFDPYEESSSNLIVPQQEIGKQKHNLRGLRVGGPSMHPLIPEKSVVVIDLDDKDYYKNRIYAVNYPENGEDIAAVKRVHDWKEGFVLMSENPNFPPELTELDWKDLCVGRVIWVWRSLDNNN